MISNDLQKNIDDWVQLNEDDICYQIALHINLMYGIKLDDEELEWNVSKHDLVQCVEVESYEQHIKDVVDMYHTLLDPYN